MKGHTGLEHSARVGVCNHIGNKEMSWTRTTTILSTSTGNSGSSGIITENFSAILFLLWNLGGFIFMWLGKGRMEGGLARMAEQPFFFSGVFLYLGNSVFVNKTLSKNNC